MNSLRKKTLEQLENDIWSEPDLDSYLLSTCHALRKKPIGKFTVEDLRVMLGQSIGIKFILPIALDILMENPLAEGDFYPGDLLGAVLRLKNSTWITYPEWREKVRSIIDKMEEMITSIERAIQKKSDREVPSQLIGELVMEKLKSLDDVAYVRFASVYRRFQDISQFMKALNEILQREKTHKRRRRG